MRQKKRFPVRTLFAFIVTVFIAASALADVTASVRGTVSDSSGAVVVGGLVVLAIRLISTRTATFWLLRKFSGWGAERWVPRLRFSCVPSPSALRPDALINYKRTR